MVTPALDRKQSDRIVRAAVARFLELYKGRSDEARKDMKARGTPKMRALLRACYAVAKDKL